MGFEKFKSHRFRAKSLARIEQANEIITEFMDDGYDLTLRQLYYQFVSKDLIENCQREYDNLGTLIGNARQAGLIDWEAIKDRTREMQANLHWDDPSEPIRNAAHWYKINTRADQPNYIEVWVEKEALAGVIEREANRLDVPWVACRGFMSLTAMKDAAERFIAAENEGKDIVIIHLGDHDPSGLDMTRDNLKRSLLLSYAAPVEVHRVALNMDQIKRYNPPPNFAKNTDSRYKPYRKIYGDESWELDALRPKTIATIIKHEVARLTDDNKLISMQKQQAEEKSQIIKVAKNWDKIISDLS